MWEYKFTHVSSSIHLLFQLNSPFCVFRPTKQLCHYLDTNKMAASIILFKLEFSFSEMIVRNYAADMASNVRQDFVLKQAAGEGNL